MPVLLEEKRSCFSSAVKDAPLIETVVQELLDRVLLRGALDGRGGGRRNGEAEQGGERRHEPKGLSHREASVLMERSNSGDVQPARVPSGTGRSGTASAGAMPSA